MRNFYVCNTHIDHLNIDKLEYPVFIKIKKFLGTIFEIFPFHWIVSCSIIISRFNHVKIEI